MKRIHTFLLLSLLALASCQKADPVAPNMDGLDIKVQSCTPYSTTARFRGNYTYINDNFKDLEFRFSTSPDMTDPIVQTIPAQSDGKLDFFAQKLKRGTKYFYEVLAANPVDLVIDQYTNVNTHFPMGRITSGRVKMDGTAVDEETKLRRDASQESLWSVTGSDGFHSVDGRLGTPYEANCLYAWVLIEESVLNEYRCTTQMMQGGDTTLLEHYSSHEAFLAACQSYGGYSSKYLAPFRNQVNYREFALPEGGSGSTGSGGTGSGSQGGSGGTGGGSQGGNGGSGGGDEFDM